MNSAMLKWFNMARIDIKNQGEGNTVDISVAMGKDCHIMKPQWFSKGGTGYIVEICDNHQVLDLRCHGDGNLFFRFRGIDRRSPEGIRLPLWVDYTRLAINDEVIFWELKSQWHDKPYTFTRPVNDGENIKVEISWSQHGYRGKELAHLISLLCIDNHSISSVKLL